MPGNQGWTGMGPDPRWAQYKYGAFGASTWPAFGHSAKLFGRRLGYTLQPRLLMAPKEAAAMAWGPQNAGLPQRLFPGFYSIGKGVAGIGKSRFGRFLAQPFKTAASNVRNARLAVNVGKSMPINSAKAMAYRNVPWKGMFSRMATAPLRHPAMFGGAAVGTGVGLGIARGIMKEVPKLIQEDLQAAGMGGIVGPLMREELKRAVGARDLGASGSMVFGMYQTRHGGYPTMPSR